MKPVQLTAIWLSFLVITLPFVFAQQINVQRFSGTDNIEGYAKADDTLVIEATAEIAGGPSEETARKRLRAYYGVTYEFFDSCKPVTGSVYECKYNTTQLTYAGKDDYSIKLFDASENLVDEVNKTITVDILSPKITELAIIPGAVRSDQEVEIIFSAEDYGRQTGLKEDCAGIKNVRITADNTTAYTSTGTVGNCKISESYKYAPSGISGFKIIKICAVATDFLGYESYPACRDFRFDSVAPRIEELTIVDTDGFEISHIKTGQAVKADVIVKIESNEDDIDEQTVFADLSKLNPAIGERRHTFKTEDDFVWQNIEITDPSPCSVKIRAADILGNSAEQTLACTLPVDDTGPELKFFGTKFKNADETFLIGVNGSIIAEFKETGSGMDKANAFIDASSLGLSSQLQADKCFAKEANWVCEWLVEPKVPTGDYEVRLLPNTQDDLGNLADRTNTTTVRFDTTPPKKPKLIEVMAFRDSQRIPAQATFLGETLEFVIQASDFETAVANFSNLGAGGSVPAEKCEGNKTKNCTFAATVSVSGPLETFARFAFLDAAGNKAQLAVPVIVLGILNETPDFWKVSGIRCSPQKLDRETMSIYDHPAYCEIRLHNSNPDAETLSVQGPVDPTECSGQTEWLSEISTAGTEPGSKNAFIAMTFVASDYAGLENIKISCPIKILTKVNDFVAKQAETEEINTTLELYNLPLGSAYQNVEDEISDVKDKVEGVWEITGKLNKILGYVQRFCQILNQIAQLLVTAGQVLAVMGVTETTVRAVPYVGPVIAEQIRNAEVAMCNPQEALTNVFNEDLFAFFKPFCDFVTCEKGLFDYLEFAGIETGEAKKSWSEGINSYYTAGLGLDKFGISLSEEYKKAGGYSEPDEYLNVKDSLVMSIVIPPLCLPGIIYNLDKWRQIECRYGLCLAKDVKDAGIPIRACKDQKSYMQCRFVVGEIFNIVPFAPLLEYYLNLYQRLASDPLVLASAVAGFIFRCEMRCSDPAAPGLTRWVCRGSALLSNLGKTAGYVKNFKSTADFGSVSPQWCEEFEEEA